MYGWGDATTPATVMPAPIPVGRTFWDFVASTSDLSAAELFRKGGA